jgi:hypothetical protein
MTMAVQADLKQYVAKKLESQPALVKGVHGRPLLYCVFLFPIASCIESELSEDVSSVCEN